MILILPAGIGMDITLEQPYCCFSSESDGLMGAILYERCFCADLDQQRRLPTTCAGAAVGSLPHCYCTDKHITRSLGIT